MIRFKEVGQLALRVTDLERSVDFYSNLLGLQVFERPQSGLVLLGCRDGRTELALMDSGGNGEAATGVHHVGYLLEDADAVEEAPAHLQARDVPFDEEPAWRNPTHGAEVHFRDPNGLLGKLFSRDTATSVIWELMYRTWVTTFAPILISFSRSVVSPNTSSNSR